MVISRVEVIAVGPVTRLITILWLPRRGTILGARLRTVNETPAAAKTQQPGPIKPSAYFSSASMILLKVADGRMTAEVLASSGQ